MCVQVGVFVVSAKSHQLDAFRRIEQECGATDKVEMDRDEVDAKSESVSHNVPTARPRSGKENVPLHFSDEENASPKLIRMRLAQCIQLIPNEDTCSIVMHRCERLSRFLARHQSKCQLFSNVV